MASPTVSSSMQADALVGQGDPALTNRDGPCSALEPLLVAVELDAKGFIKTGTDLSREQLSTARWPRARPPQLLETSVPGVFAVGDVRGGSMKTPRGMQYGFTSNGQRGVYSSTLFGQMLFSYGGNWLDSHNRPTLLTPEAHEALSMLQKLMKYADPSVVNAADNETINAMASGVAVYAPNGWGNPALSWLPGQMPGRRPAPHRGFPRSPPGRSGSFHRGSRCALRPCCRSQ
jgi:hypothetical protein